MNVADKQAAGYGLFEGLLQPKSGIVYSTRGGISNNIEGERTRILSTNEAKRNKTNEEDIMRLPCFLQN